MHSSHLGSILGNLEHTKNLIGTRLLVDPQLLSASYLPTPRSLVFAEAIRQPFQPIAEGARWGQNLDEAWFHLTGTIPPGWAGKPVVAWVDLGTEALVHAGDGTVLNSLNSGGAFDGTSWKNARPFIHLHQRARGGEAVDLYLNATCFAHPGAVDHGGPVPGVITMAGMPLGTVHRIRICVLDAAAWQLYYDVEVLLNLQGVLPANSVRRARIIAALRTAAQAFVREGDLERCHRLLEPVLDARANASALTAIAIGHGHLDSAWLWTLATSRKKFARTSSNQLHLIERFPDYVFGASSAAHYQWLAEDHPALAARVSQAMRQGQWEVLGPMWVEPDCLVPAGESLIRQCLHGSHYFQATTGAAPTFAWLPDTFGFAPSLPQILRHCGCDTLITTKISWNSCNRPRHHSFRWRGIDGSEVAVHFPPDGSYESSLLPDALLQGEEGYGEKAELEQFLVVFGHGDGGGGPHERHLMRGQRAHDLEGVPRVTFGQASAFQRFLISRWDALPVLSDEIYLENHQGTLTTHGDIKLHNRRLEQMLSASECLLTHGQLAGYPAAALDALWKTLLLHQFHDILPGTSIREVYLEALPALDGAREACLALCRSFAASQCPADANSWLLFNSLNLPWEGVVTLPEHWHGRGLVDHAGQALATQREGAHTVAWVVIPALGFLALSPSGQAVDALLAQPQPPLVQNAHVQAVFCAESGLLSALNGLLPCDAHGNEFRLYADHPAQWDAWNLELDYRQQPLETMRCQRCELVIQGPVRSCISLQGTIGSSTITQHISLPNAGRRLDFATTVDWHETHRFLRVAFPTAIDSPAASYQIQHGWCSRPTHDLTETTSARIEYAAHQFVDLSVPGRGLALLNDGKYGHIVDGRVIELGLLRAPVFPDCLADRGINHMTFALVPHLEAFPCQQVVVAADQLNRAPLELGALGLPRQPLSPPLRLETQTIALEAMKRAEDGAGWIIRLSNRLGLPGVARLSAATPLRLQPCNGLERALGEPLAPAQSWEFPLRPFELQTWRVAP